MSKLLINENPLQVLPSLAKAIGLNEAMILQQLHYWLPHATKTHDGSKWVYKSYEDWVESDFPFWSESTVKRAFASLKKQGLVIVKKLASGNGHHINFYTINYKKLDEIEDKIHEVKMTQSNGSECTDAQVKMTRSRRGQNDPFNKENTKENTTEIKKTNKQNRGKNSFSEKKEKTDEETLVDFWNEKSGGSVKLNTWKKTLTARLKNYSVEEIKKAMLSVITSQWHIANGQVSIDKAISSDQRCDGAIARYNQPQTTGNRHANNQPANSEFNTADHFDDLRQQAKAKYGNAQRTNDMRTVS